MYRLEKNSLKNMVSKPFLLAKVIRLNKVSLFKLFGAILYKWVNGISPEAIPPCKIKDVFCPDKYGIS